MRLSQEVTVEDVKEAVRLIRSAIKESATDPVTGRIDMDLLAGISGSERRRKEDLKRAVRGVLDEVCAGGGSVRYSELLRRVQEGSSVEVSAGEFAEAVRGVESEGGCVVAGDGARRTVRRVTVQV